MTKLGGVFKKMGLFLLLGGLSPSLKADGIGVDGGAAGSIPDIAKNYVIRMQEQVKRADDAALRGSQLMADGDYEGAVEQYNQAIDLLPDAPMTEQRRKAYVQQYAKAATTLARNYADSGKYNEAMGLIENVLRPTVSPDNLAAKKLLEQLNDPGYYSPALSPAHLERVRKVRMALLTGQGYLDYGDYDKAEREYQKALSIDRYNEAGRRSIEDVERHRMNYYDVARDQTRSTFLRQIAQEWEMQVPTTFDVPDIAIGNNTGTENIIKNEEKLKTIRIPSVEFSDTPLKDALLFLQQKSVELDITETDINRKGVNILLNVDSGGGGAAAPAPAAAPGGFGFEGGGGGGAALGGGGGGVGNTPITLKLTNVPLGEALRYTTNLAQLKYKVESHAVVVVPLSTPDADLFTNQYTVPPTFISGAAGGGGGAAAGPVDPFAAGAGGGAAAAPATRMTAKQVLENAGITFAGAATAIYNPGTSTLIVKNTPDQMDLVEAYIESIKGGVEKQIYITSKFIEISEEVGKELGFDWMLGGFNFGATPRVFGAGGTPGAAAGANNPLDFSFINPGTTTPVGSQPLTSALRSGSRAIDSNSIDALISEASGGAAITNRNAPSVFGISGVFTDPQFQMMIRALNQKKGVDLLSAPSVMARSGNRAKIEVIREFIYPTEYDPPEIPNQFGGSTVLTTLPGVSSSSGGFPVTPATPTAFEVRNTGVTLEVDPVLGADNYTIDLNLAPEVVEFDGFINYGSPIQTTGTSALGLPTTLVLTENRIEMPVFNTRKVTTQVTIWDGQTVALGGLIREDIQDVEDKIPFLGDLPAIGRLFRSNVELHLKRNLTIFVKAVIQDPSGKPIHGAGDDEAPNYLEPRPKLTAPPVNFPMPVGYGK